MKKAFVLVMIVMMSIGACGQQKGGGEEYSLEGTWIIDVEKTLVEIENSSASDKRKQEDKEFFSSEMMRAVEYKFSGSGKTEIRNRPGTDGSVNGTWEAVSKEGNCWIVVMKEPGTPPERSVFTWLDKDHVSVGEEGKPDVIWLKRK